jgi:hypothetical protein
VAVISIKYAKATLNWVCFKCLFQHNKKNAIFVVYFGQIENLPSPIAEGDSISCLALKFLLLFVKKKTSVVKPSQIEARKKTVFKIIIIAATGRIVYLATAKR